MKLCSLVGADAMRGSGIRSRRFPRAKQPVDGSRRLAIVLQLQVGEVYIYDLKPSWAGGGWKETGDRIPVGEGGANFPHRSRPALGSTHSASGTMGAGSISGGGDWPGGWRGVDHTLDL